MAKSIPEVKYHKFEVKDAKGIISSKFFDDHTLYIENNGNPDESVRKLIDAIIMTHPKFVKEYENKPYRRGELYSDISVHSDEPKRDCSYIFVYSSRLYRYIVGRDPESGKAKIRRELTAAELAAKNAEQGATMSLTSWADETDLGDQIEYKYDALTRQWHVPGVSLVDDPIFEHRWKEFLELPGDIAIMRGYVSPVFDKYVPNRLIIDNLPSIAVDPSYAATLVGRYATTKLEKVDAFTPEVKHETYKDKDGKARARVEVTYDPNTMDASFASIFFRNMSYTLKSGEVVKPTCRYVLKGKPRR